MQVTKTRMVERPLTEMVAVLDEAGELVMQGEEMLKVVDFKCDPILIGTLREEPGFFPAYHMSKDSWITVALDVQRIR